SEISTSPTCRPGPVTILMTPGGKVSANTFKNSLIVKGQFVAGFTTTVFPVKIAGTTRLIVRITGEFQGVIIAVTPLGLRNTFTCCFSLDKSTSSYQSSSASGVSPNT